MDGQTQLANAGKGKKNVVDQSSSIKEETKDNSTSKSTNANSVEQ